MDDASLARLGQAIRARRHQLQLSEREAAQRAQIARNTWAVAESGNRAVRDYSHVRIENALCWAPGSIAAILDGGDPTLDDSRQVAGVSPERRASEPFDLDYELARVQRLDLPASTRLQLIRRIVGLYEEASREAEAERADTSTRQEAG